MKSNIIGTWLNNEDSDEDCHVN